MVYLLKIGCFSHHVALLDVIIAVCHELVGQLGDVHKPVHLRFFTKRPDRDGEDGNDEPPFKRF